MRVRVSSYMIAGSEISKFLYKGMDLVLDFKMLTTFMELIDSPNDVATPEERDFEALDRDLDDYIAGKVTIKAPDPNRGYQPKDNRQYKRPVRRSKKQWKRKQRASDQKKKDKKSNKRRRQTNCFFFEKGSCRAGDNCDWYHNKRAFKVRKSNHWPSPPQKSRNQELADIAAAAVHGAVRAYLEHGQKK